eukprot:SAG11_NODE_13813_length_638_cov_0.851577_1_plen_100_part_00
MENSIDDDEIRGSVVAGEISVSFILAADEVATMEMPPPMVVSFHSVSSLVFHPFAEHMVFEMIAAYDATAELLAACVRRTPRVLPRFCTTTRGRALVLL